MVVNLRRSAIVLAAVALSAAALAACGSTAATPSSAKPAVSHTTTTSQHTTLMSTAPAIAGTKSMLLEGAHAYQPHPPPGGGTDDYHCTLLDPHVTQNSYIVASHFFPNSKEVHHAILFEIPPNMAAAARAADGNGKGWTCFGESALPGSGLAQLGATPWLAAWAPGHGLDRTPAGTGVYFPAGSMVVMQIHYNLLEGHAPVHAQLALYTVPATRNLIPLHLDLLPAPPDIPCPSGVHGPLCNRAASLKNLGQVFGQPLVDFVNFLESFCGRSQTEPPAGDTTSCNWPVGFSGQILRVTPHMHLLGTKMKVTLNPGKPGSKVLLNDQDYNFDYQRSFNITPTYVHPGDTIQVSCTYNARLRQELPQLRKLAPRFVTWGDGTSDEMCLGILDWVAGDTYHS